MFRNVFSRRSKQKEEGKDINFDEGVLDVPIPHDPKNADLSDTDDIDENVEGEEAMSLANVPTGYFEIKQSIQKERSSGRDSLYEDVGFPTNKKSLYFSKRAPTNWSRIKWKRPFEIASSPRLLQDDISSEDIVQGMLGDCWWLSSCAAIARNPKFIKKIIPPDQPMSGENYLGVFHFRFWRFGKWVDVVVDDNLPTINGQLCFGRSSDPNEFWLPLLEKAYAKMHNSYQAMEGGFTQDGMEDLTGGIAVSYRLGDETPKNLFRTILQAIRHNSFVGAGIGGSDGEVEDKKTGLIAGHAYAVLDATRVHYQGKKVNIIKVRNPWGNQQEWTGEWSDDSSNWSAVSEKVRKRLGYADADNGEWWMNFKDFSTYFSDVTICSIGPDFDGDGAPTGDKWLLTSLHGEWTKDTAGGCRNDIPSYTKNPQYYMELKEADDFDPEEDDPSEKGKCSVLVGLMQENRRKQVSEGVENLFLVANIFKVNEKPRGKLGARYFKRNNHVASSGQYTNKREVTVAAELDPGKYVIVPSSFHAGGLGSFLIRIFTEKSVEIQEL